jgi:hypothetical protein
MAKTILPASSYNYIPFSQQVDFTNFTTATGEVFNFSRLYAIIDVTAGQIIYTTSGTSSGYGGSYAAPTLFLSYNTTPFTGSELQIIYDLANSPSATYDGTGTQPILSSTDPITGREGLDINLLNSSFGGQLTLPLPSSTTSGYNAALSMGFINGGNLVAPNMDPMTNNLKVDVDSFSATATIPVTITGSSIIQPVDMTYVAGAPVSTANPLPTGLASSSGNVIDYNQGASSANTIRTASNQYTSTGFALEYGNGIIGGGAQRMALGDYAFSGVAGVTAIVNNMITNSALSSDLNGYRYFSIQIVSTATAGTFIFETSNDNTNWQPLAVSNQSLTTGVIITSAITATASSYIYVGTMTGRYLRIRVVTTLTGGSAQAVCRFSQVAPLANNVTISSGSASTVAPNIDVLGSAVSGSRYNQIEIDFNSVPSSTLITNTNNNGTITASNGHSLYATSSTATSSAKGVSVGIVQYRAANELYSYFSAAFTVSGGSRTANSYQRIGIYDTNNGFFIGYSGTNFGVTKRTAASDTFTSRTVWNGDLLDGNPASKFTRNNIPEAIDFTKSNLFRIRFAWLGSACILFDVYSPDGIWVNYHTIKQPNIDFNPSLTVPNLPMTIDCAKTVSGAEVLTIATACWAGGTSSSYSPITATLTDQSLAALNRSVITGVTTGGGGGYVNVKVNPSGSLVTDATISSSALPTGASTSALQTTGNAVLTSIDASLTSINTKTPSLGSTSSSLSQPVVIASDQIVPVAPNAPAVFGSITSLGGSTTLSMGGYTAAVIDLRGTFTATLQFQGTIDGTNWISLQAIPYGSAQNTNLVTSTTGPGAWLVQCAGCAQVRVNPSAYTSGTITTVLRATMATSWTYNAPVGTTNAIAVASGTLTTVATVTTCATVTTVGSVTSDNLASATTTDIASAATTSTSTSANVATTNQQSVSFLVNVGAVTGTSPTMDVVVQETYDGTNFYDIYHFERITASGQYYSPVMKLAGIGIRYVRTLGGTSPSFTNGVSRISRAGNAPTIRRSFDRTIAPNTLSSTTPAILVDGCDEIQLTVSMASGGTVPPVFGIQASEDNVNWCNFQSAVVTLTGTPSVTACAAGTIGYLPKYIRGYVSTAGTGATINWVCLKAKGA